MFLLFILRRLKSRGQSLELHLWEVEEVEQSRVHMVIQVRSYYSPTHHVQNQYYFRGKTAKIVFSNS